MKKFSFLIASKRDYNKYARLVVDAIFSRYKNTNDYEVVICHTDNIVDDRVVFVKDDRLSGPSYAYNTAYKNSVGQYVFVCVDDCVIHGDILGSIDFIESSVFNYRKFKIATVSASPFNDVTRFEPLPANGKRRPEKFLHFTGNLGFIRPFTVMPFPIVSRHTIDNYLGGHIKHPRIKACADWWLGAFLYLNGEEGLQYNGAYIQTTINEDMVHDLVFDNMQCKYFGESWVNTYRLIKNYRQGDEYVYDEEDDYISEKCLSSLSNNMCNLGEKYENTYRLTKIV